MEEESGKRKEGNSLKERKNVFLPNFIFSLCFLLPFSSTFLFLTSSLFFHLSLITALIRLNLQPQTPDQTVALTRRVTDRKRRHLKVFVPICYFSVDHVDADSQHENVVKLMNSFEQQNDSLFE